MKGEGFYAENNVPRQIVFGTELTDDVGGKRELITTDSIAWNDTENRLEIELSKNVTAGITDLLFNRLAIIRGGKAQGAYVGNLDVASNSITITTPSTLAEPFVAGDKLVSEDFIEYTVTNVSGSVLTVAETITTNATDKNLHDASGVMMVVYVFVQDATIFANSTTNVKFNGYDFAG